MKLVPKLGENIPQRGNALTGFIGKTIMRLSGWHVEGELPNIKKFVFIGAPHTSNWDGIIAVYTIFAMGLKMSIMTKHTMFRWPFTRLFKWFGLIPIERSTTHGVVEQTINLFNTNEKLIIGIPPEGTRKKVEKWKTGFHRIAVGANVPIVTASIDFPSKTLYFDGPFTPTADIDADIAFFKEHFGRVVPKHPDRF